MKNKTVFTSIKEWLLVTVGILIYVVGWVTFLVPQNLIGGGVTGLGSIVQYATGGVIKMGYTYLLVNCILLVASLFILGKGFGLKTVYAVILASAGLNYFQGHIPQPILDNLVFENGKLMCVIMGAIMSGSGIALSMINGGSTGGTDIIALIVNKYRNVSPGKMILRLDFVIICSSLLVPSYTLSGDLVPFVDKVTTVVYALILVVISSTVVDLLISGSRQSVQLFVLSKKYAEIADAITNDLHRGVTVLDGKGWYTKQDTKVLMVITRKVDLNILLKYIKSIDPEAFLSVSSVTGVYGKGFEKIKGKQ